MNLETLPYLMNAILAICLTIGAFLAVRNGRQSKLTEFQEKTVTAYKDRIDLLERRIVELEKENAIQRHIIDTITTALKTRGIAITIDGDMVTISDKSGSIHRKRTMTTQATIIQKKAEE